MEFWLFFLNILNYPNLLNSRKYFPFIWRAAIEIPFLLLHIWVLAFTGTDFIINRFTNAELYHNMSTLFIAIAVGVLSPPRFERKFFFFLHQIVNIFYLLHLTVFLPFSPPFSPFPVLYLSLDQIYASACNWLSWTSSELVPLNFLF